MTDQRSEDDQMPRLYTGCLWRDGRWCHTWSDGTALPVLSGRDEGDEDEDDDADSGGADDGDGDEDDDDEDDKGVKNPRIKKLSDENAKYRNQRNNVRKERDDARTEATTLKAKISDLETQLKDGGSDEKLKSRVTELEGQVKSIGDERDDLKGKLDKANGEIAKVNVNSQIEDVAKRLKVKEPVKIVRYLLEDAKLLTVDEDGDVEDLERNIKKLLKSKELNVLSEDDEDDDDDDESASGGSRSSGRPMNRPKKKGDGLDRTTLEKKFPALRR